MELPKVELLVHAQLAATPRKYKRYKNVKDYLFAKDAQPPLPLFSDAADLCVVLFCSLRFPAACSSKLAWILLDALK